MGLLSKLNNLLFKEKEDSYNDIGYIKLPFERHSINQDFREYLKFKPYLNNDDEVNFNTMRDLIHVFCFHKSENILDELDYELVHRLWFLLYHYIFAQPTMYFNSLSKSDRVYLIHLLDEVTKTRIRLFGIKNNKDHENPFESIIKIAKEAGKENN